MNLNEKIAPFEHIFDKNCFGHLSTLMKDGSPHSTPLWVIYDKENFTIQLTIEKGSIKDINTDRDPRVCVSISDPDNPYHYVQIRGTVISKVLDKEEAYLDALYRKFSNGKHQKYWSNYNNPILILTIKPLNITGWGKESSYEFQNKILNG